MSSDEEEGCSTIIVDEQKHIMAHKILDIIHTVGTNYDWIYNPNGKGTEIQFIV